MDKKEFDELVRMLQGNIARLVLSGDENEINRMCDWAHKRIDLIVKARLEEINEYNNHLKNKNKE